MNFGMYVGYNTLVNDLGERNISYSIVFGTNFQERKMKKLLILLFMFPLMAQSINDTDEARQEYMESVREQEQMRQEKFNKQKQLRREQQVNEMMLRMKKQDKKRKHIIKKKIRIK